MNSSTNKTIKRLALAMCFMTAAALAACTGNKGGPVDPGAGAPPSIVPTGPDIRTCNVGQVHTLQYGCLNQNSCQLGFGWVPGANRCVPGTIVTDVIKHGVAQPERFGGMVNLTNSKQLGLLLKHYTGQCDPFMWTLGTWTCSYVMNQGVYVEIGSSGGPNPTAKLQIVAGTRLPISSMPGRIYLSFPAAIYDHNNSQGTQVVTSGEVGLRAVIHQGRFGTGRQGFTVILKAGDIQIGTANVSRVF